MEKKQKVSIAIGASLTGILAMIVAAKGINEFHRTTVEGQIAIAQLQNPKAASTVTKPRETTKKSK